MRQSDDRSGDVRVVSRHVAYPQHPHVAAGFRTKFPLTDQLSTRFTPLRLLTTTEAYRPPFLSEPSTIGTASVVTQILAVRFVDATNHPVVTCRVTDERVSHRRAARIH